MSFSLSPFPYILIPFSLCPYIHLSIFYCYLILSFPHSFFLVLFHSLVHFLTHLFHYYFISLTLSILSLNHNFPLSILISLFVYILLFSPFTYPFFPFLSYLISPSLLLVLSPFLFVSLFHHSSFPPLSNLIYIFG